MALTAVEPAPAARAAYPGCCSALRLAFSRLGVPAVSQELMMASLSKNTLQQYNVTLKAWWHYCLENNLDFFNSSISRVISFLSEQFNRGASYGTLNSHRSAISLFLGNNIGSNAYVKRLLKGAYKLRPSLPKYSHTWDPQRLLDYIADWYPNTSLTVEKITKKLVILLALCTAHRVQTLSLIKINKVSIGPTGVKIIITDIIKTSAAGRSQPILFLPYFREKPNICPATVLRDYIALTRDIRPENALNLLLTVKRPFKCATAQTIGRWIKQVMAESGVDVAAFGAHSTRHAATSAAAAAGVSVDTIRKTASWTNNSQAFAKFYHRQIIDEGSFARAVCHISNDINLSLE
ncbi:hypothetical protein MSG28_005631 [Choristoneura fumiferana]|uniref:Uncharacterized protein n=1 Tax=Choristoneura fumiferana TaxID=7141 RepID=A0ACC0L051_CHOFU|nr:hypothetical protein MSG28_005631 [Choristoneura fumiferana]